MAKNDQAAEAKAKAAAEAKAKAAAEAKAKAAAEAKAKAEAEAKAKAEAEAKAKAEAEAKAKAEAEAKAKAAAEAAAGKGKTVKVPALSVVSSREGFRRGGRAWSKTATVVKLSELSGAQIAQIKGEAMLTVEEIDVDEEVVE